MIHSFFKGKLNKLDRKIQRKRKIQRMTDAEEDRKIETYKYRGRQRYKDRQKDAETDR